MCFPAEHMVQVGGAVTPEIPAVHGVSGDFPRSARPLPPDYPPDYQVCESDTSWSM